jgi:NDP-4-keto-2,6-dideoxyhexose 3-C-methyltransferase
MRGVVVVLYKKIEGCRICGNSQLDLILDLGEMALTGIFPKTKSEEVPTGPLTLVKCRETIPGDSCGLVQLKETYSPDLMYGQNYGYRSGLNKSMVDHLHSKVKRILDHVALSPNDIVMDIGSNDSTLLQAYPKKQTTLVGFDPTGKKFKKYYPDHIILVTDFFSAETFKSKFENKKAKVITSIAMFYDLEKPLEFVRDVYDILSEDGIWVLEQSYMPLMLEVNAFDTICHEHLEYYRLKQIQWMMKKVGFKIIDIEFNQVNGGSFSITAAKLDSSLPETPDVARLLADEESKGLSTNKPYDEFRNQVFEFKSSIRQLLDKILNEKGLILGYGASTKGNVLLQFTGITSRDIPYIGEINTDKFGCYTPGTLIPIISEEEARKMNPDYFFVFPWHFKDFILQKEKSSSNKRVPLLFPLPSIEIF